jgi:hypothetical protein
VPVTVNPTPVIHLVNSDTALCSGSSTAIAVHASTGGTFSWADTASSSIITGQSAGSSTGKTLLLSQALANSTHTQYGSVAYTLRFVSNATPGCPALPIPKSSVAVNPPPAGPSFTLAPATTGLCENTLNQNFSVKPSASTNNILRWEVLDSTVNGKIVHISTDSLNAIISLNQDTVKVIAVEEDASHSTRCPAASLPYTVTLNNTTQTNPTVIFDGTDYVCLDNQADSYQWGFDYINTYLADTIAGQTFQNLYLAPGSPRDEHYWVITKTGSCYSKNY